MRICQVKLPPFWVATLFEQLLGLLYEPIIRDESSRGWVSLWLDFIAGSDKFFLRTCTQIRMNYRCVEFPHGDCRLQSKVYPVEYPIPIHVIQKEISRIRPQRVYRFLHILTGASEVITHALELIAHFSVHRDYLRCGALPEF